MRSSLECVPCLVRQAMESVRQTIPDESRREELLRKFLREIAEMDFDMPPPAVAQKIHRALRSESGVDDPYREAKDRFTSMALGLLPSLEEQVKSAADPFLAALKLSIAANIIDLGVDGELTEEEALLSMEKALDLPVAGDVEAFVETARSARSILYLADNAGEIVFDRPLVRLLPSGRVSIAVRGAPVINDAVMRDAIESGIDELAPVIENGSDAPGTILKDCSSEFLKAFGEADMIISKGQGNYETLCDEDAPIFFLFKVKCQAVERHSGLPLGTHALLRGRGFS